MENEYLAHHGVKGMKWGVRKAEKPSGNRKRMSKREAKAEERKQKIIARNKAYMEDPGVAKHVKFDDEGYKITGISKALQKALDAPLEDIDDEELIFVTAMELGGDSNLEHANQYLAHHGVKGMKWGVRSAETLRKYSASGNAASKNKAGVVSEIKARREAKKPTFEQRRETALTTHSAKKLAQNMDTLDDKELQQRYNRLNLEQNVRNLSRSQVSSGRKMVGNVGKEVAKEYAKKYAKKGAKYLIGAGASYAAPKVAGVGVKTLTKLPGGW